MSLIPLNRTLKNGKNGNFYVTCVLSQQKLSNKGTSGLGSREENHRFRSNSEITNEVATAPRAEGLHPRSLWLGSPAGLEPRCLPIPHAALASHRCLGPVWFHDLDAQSQNRKLWHLGSWGRRGRALSCHPVPATHRPKTWGLHEPVPLAG